MKFILFLLSVALTTASQVCLGDTTTPGKCPRYLKGNNLEEDVCIENDPSGDIFVGTCTAPRYCQVNEDQYVNVCTDPLPIKDLYPGELCTNNDECYSMSCTDGQCKGLKLNDKCTRLIECEPGLRCDKEKAEDLGNKCLMAKKIGEECNSSLDCAVPLRCVKRKCVEPGSQPIGTVLGTSNDGISKKLACQSYYAEQNDKEEWLCAKSPQLLGQTWPLKEPPLCTPEIPCEYDNQDIKDGCKCGKTENADSYCKVYAGDFNLTEVSFSLMTISSLNIIIMLIPECSIDCVLLTAT